MAVVPQDFKDLKSQITLLVGSDVESLERCMAAQKRPAIAMT